jgi:hypothetical protein
MSSDEPHPYTADNGRIVVDEELGGLLWRGRQLQPRERPLVIAIKDLAAASGKEMLERWCRFDVPGIAPLAYLGFPHGTPSDPEALRDLKKRGHPLVALLAEAQPPGLPLAGVVEEEPLTDAEVVRIGLGLCDTAVAWLDRRETAIVGFRPETIYIAGDMPGERYYAGATPRVCAWIGSGGSDGTFPATYYGAPLASSSTQIDSTDLAFVIGLVLWYAATREHAYSHIYYIEHARPEFHGTAELGDLCDAVLRLDNARIGVHTLRDRLRALAADWKVEPPPFPPPGLAD